MIIKTKVETRTIDFTNPVRNSSKLTQGWLDDNSDCCDGTLSRELVSRICRKRLRKGALKPIEGSQSLPTILRIISHTI